MTTGDGRDESRPGTRYGGRMVDVRREHLHDDADGPRASLSNGQPGHAERLAAILERVAAYYRAHPDDTDGDPIVRGRRQRPTGPRVP